MIRLQKKMQRHIAPMKRFSFFITSIAACVFMFGLVGKAHSIDGNSLVEMCNSQEIDMLNGCAGYIAGAIDMLQNTNELRPEDGGSRFKICIPTGLDPQQAQDVVISSIRANPKYRHYRAAFSVLIALTDAFPCQ